MLKFNLSKLTCALAALSLTTMAGAAGLDRSGQPSEDFSSSGTIAYASAYHISPDISGVESNGIRLEILEKSMKATVMASRPISMTNLVLACFLTSPLVRRFFSKVMITH